MIEPSQPAIEIADRMLGDVDTQSQIIDETLESAEIEGIPFESGRTVCGDSVYEPEKRREKSVRLQECRIGHDGIMHSHVSVSQLQNPEHSLPDITNVIIEGAEASVVVGTQTHDVLLAPADREAAKKELEDALGMRIGGTGEIVQAIEDGKIRSTTDARRRIRSRLPELFEVVPSQLGEFDQDLHRLSSSNAIPARAPIDGSHHPRTDGSVITECIEGKRRRREQNKAMVQETASAVAQQLTPSNLITIAVVSAVTGIMADSIRRSIRQQT